MLEVARDGSSIYAISVSAKPLQVGLHTGRGRTQAGKMNDGDGAFYSLVTTLAGEGETCRRAMRVYGHARQQPLAANRKTSGYATVEWPDPHYGQPRFYQTPALNRICMFCVKFKRFSRYRYSHVGATRDAK